DARASMTAIGTEGRVPSVGATTAEIEGATDQAAGLLHGDVCKRPQHGACRSRGQQGAIRQPQAAFEAGRRLPHAQYLATGNDARHRRGLKIAHRHLEGWHHHGEALRDAGGYPHGIVEHSAYETALYDAGQVGELKPGHECYLRPALGDGKVDQLEAQMT